MRKMVLLMAAMGALLVLTAGLALAVTKSGGSGNDNLRGTNGADVLSGGSGDDVLRGLVGADRLSSGSGEDEVFGGSGRDAISGGSGDDFISDGDDGVRDTINCGTGFDTVRADRVDNLDDCERVTRR